MDALPVHGKRTQSEVAQNDGKLTQGGHGFLLAPACSLSLQLGWSRLQREMVGFQVRVPQKWAKIRVPLRAAPAPSPLAFNLFVL